VEQLINELQPIGSHTSDGQMSLFLVRARLDGLVVGEHRCGVGTNPGDRAAQRSVAAIGRIEKLREQCARVADGMSAAPQDVASAQDETDHARARLKSALSSAALAHEAAAFGVGDVGRPS
jgi:hypothetical protein